MSSTSTSTTTTTPTFLQCKVYLKPTDQVRRIQIDANCSLADFIHVAHQLYASNPLLAQQQQRMQPTVTISVTYMDEESDWITVTTDPEWRDALQRQVQLLKSQSSLLFKVQCTQIALPTRPQQPQQQQHSVPTANAVGETLCSTACSLIDQVKRGHHQHVQPLVEQARDKTKDKVKKIQNWINESEDLHSIKQTFRDVLDTVVDEGSTTAALLISQLYKDIETIATVTGATTSAASGSASSSTWYANNDEGDDEIVHQERQEEAQEEPREEQEQEQQHQEEEAEQQGEVNVAPEDDFVFVDNEHLPEQQAQEEQHLVVEQEEEEEEQQQPVEEPTPVEAEPEPMPVIEQQQPEEGEEEEEEEQEQQQEVQAVHEEPEAIPAPVQEQPQPQPQPQPQQPVDPRYQQYADKLTSLREMGFNDIGTNLNLLIKHKGDLTQVVTELLSL